MARKFEDMLSRTHRPSKVAVGKRVLKHEEASRALKEMLVYRCLIACKVYAEWV